MKTVTQHTHWMLKVRLKENPIHHSSLTHKFGGEKLCLQFFVMLKTVPVFPGVCVGGPEVKTGSTESNE